jgi:hypothetical protein
METQDRRQQPRRPLDEEVLAYLDGDRLDARTGNISEGGLYLRSSRPEEFPLGASVALVFRDPVPPSGEVFLVARVVRHQAGLEGGVGLRWDRAVTIGDAEPLRRVLRRLFKFNDPVLEVLQLPDRSARQHTYRFTRRDEWPAGRKVVDVPPAVPPPAPPPPRQAPEPQRVTEPPRGPDPQPPAPEPARVAIPMPAVPLESGRVPGSMPLDSGRIPGSVPQPPDPIDHRQALDLPGTLEFAGAAVPVRLCWMGSGSAGVECAWLPADPDALLRLRFQIPLRQDPVDIQGPARVRSVDRIPGGHPAVLELSLGPMDEGGHRGVLLRYLLWLGRQQASGEDAGA